MNKILYITNQDFTENSGIGVSKKIFGQVKAFNESGIDTDILFFENSKAVLLEYSSNNKVSLFGEKKIKNRRIAIYKSLYYLLKSRKYSTLYIRYFYADPILILILKKAKICKINIIVEIPTYPYKCELVKYSKGKLQFFIDKICSCYLKNYIDKIVTYSNDKQIFSVGCINIENAIDKSIIKINKKKKYIESTKKIYLIGVANINYWHGFDRVLEGLSEYYNNDFKDVEIFFDIIGESKYCEELKGYVKKNNLSKYVHFKGIYKGEKLYELYENYDIAIGSLGLHRLSLNSASTLKSKEYFANGIPFIKSYHENFMENINFNACLNFPADDTPIKIDFIKNKFLEGYFNNVSSEMINFAENNLTWSKQMDKIIKFIKER